MSRQISDSTSVKQHQTDYKKRNGRKIYYFCTKLISSDSHINEASMHQNIMTKIKKKCLLFLGCNYKAQYFWLSIKEKI